MIVITQATKTINTDLAVEKFKLVIAEKNLDSTLISDVQCIARGAIQIVVNHRWYQQPTTVRLKTARRLQNLWAIVYSPTAPAKARIRLINQNGLPLGGSFLRDGSYINLVHD